MIELWEYAFASVQPIFDNEVNNLLLSSLIGGAMFGAGLGLIFRCDSSTGGTDIFIKLHRKKFRYIKTGVISMIID